MRRAALLRAGRQHRALLHVLRCGSLVRCKAPRLRRPWRGRRRGRLQRRTEARRVATLFSKNVALSWSGTCSTTRPPPCSDGTLRRAVRSITVARQLDSELLGEVRQVAATVLRNHDEVLDADAAHPRFVEAGLHRHHVAGNQLLLGHRDAGGFVELQTHPMAGTMDKAFRERLARLLVVLERLVATLVQDVRDLSVNVAAVDAGFYHRERRLLALQDGVVHLL